MMSESKLMMIVITVVVAIAGIDYAVEYKPKLPVRRVVPQSDMLMWRGFEPNERQRKAFNNLKVRPMRNNVRTAPIYEFYICNPPLCFIRPSPIYINVNSGSVSTNQQPVELETVDPLRITCVIPFPDGTCIYAKEQ